jgi:phosphomannomutase
MKWEGATDNLREAYFAHLDTVVNSHSLASSGWRVLVNPMHGVGAGYVDGYLERAGVEVLAINGERDVYFGGGLPDPSPGNLTPLATALVEDDCQLLVGTDGDADRFGLVDPAGRYYGANHALPLLADYLITYRKLQGSLVRTVATSHLLDDVAAEHSLELIETAVGFKYVGAKLREGALIGGEESGGISVKGHIPEKDGILASVLMLEMAATRGDSLAEVYDELLKRYGPRDYVRIDQQLPESDKQRLLARLAAFDGDKFAGKQIERRVTIDGYKFIFPDKSWVMLRASGTEPVVRIYIETTAPETLPKWRNQILDEVKSLLK